MILKFQSSSIIYPFMTQLPHKAVLWINYQNHICLSFSTYSPSLFQLIIVGQNYSNNKDMAMSRSSNLNSTPRPKSAIAYRSAHHKQHRIEDNESLNSIRNDIHKVFSQENKSLKEVKDLTSKVDSAYAHRIDRMCIQYSICANPKKQKRLSEDIDVEFIAKRYIKAKSKDKKKEEERTELKKSIGQTSRRYMSNQPEEFFKFNHDVLRKMELRASKKSSSLARREHPYIALYQKSQIQALTHLTERNTLALQELSNHPVFAEPDDWQKQSRQIKQIYSGVKILRSNTLRYRQRKKDGDDVDSFYIT